MSAKPNILEVGRRRLILRDSLAFLSLLLGTGVLFAITLFLFRSFTAHRQVLAQRWSERGRVALKAGEPEDAIVALRTALSYAPDTRDYELLLADALGRAGHTEESYQYFMELWDVQPGNGQVNLQLARLAARRNDRTAATNFYRASIFGTWGGDGVERRADVRLELARYLIAQGDSAAARLELLIGGGNAPDDYARDMAIGGLFEQAQDPANAWTYYQRALALRPNDAVAQETAGRLAFEAGDYESAARLLARAGAEREKSGDVGTLATADRRMARDAARVLELGPTADQPAGSRVAHTVAVRAIAKKRFEGCSALTQTEPISSRWIGPEGNASASALLRDPALQTAVMQLVFDTEVRAEELCGPATGDDALLVRLARHPPTKLSVSEKPTQATVAHE